MFIFNFKVNGNIFSKILFVLMLIIIICIFIFGIYLIFFKKNDIITVSDTIKSEEIFEITESNYTNILKVANENIDSYIGCKVHFTGYVYRLIDFNENQFVLARDMLVNNDSQALIVGFLCNYKNARDFEDGTWVDVVGEISKGYFNGDVAQLDVISIKKIDKPSDNIFVSLPDDTYIPTSNMF